jgi:hypothetical protein
VEVSGLGGPVLTIAPSVTIELQSGVEFYCGVDNPGAIVADGSRGQIVFTSARASPSPGDWLDLGFYDKSSAQCTLSYCKIEYGGGNRGDIYIRNTNKPNITNDSVGRSSSWGIYLDGFTFPDSVALRQLNTFYLDSLGDIHRP